MFAKILGLWIYALASQDYSFRDTRLQIALEFYREGQQFVVEEKYRDACDAFMAGVFAGRRVVEELHTSANDDSAAAMSWLVTSYIECAKARMKLGDWQTARADAWAACMFSQNKDLQALQCMLTVCQSSDDSFGELSTLKSILPLLESAEEIESSFATAHSLSLNSITEQIKMVEKKLQQRFKS